MFWPTVQQFWLTAQHVLVDCTACFGWLHGMFWLAAQQVLDVLQWMPILQLRANEIITKQKPGVSFTQRLDSASSD